MKHNWVFIKLLLKLPNGNRIFIKFTFKKKKNNQKILLQSNQIFSYM